MADAKVANKNPGIPEGYLAVPVSQSETGAALRLCVLVRQTPDPAAGALVLLRDLPDAQVYLGCVTDITGRVHGWLELWVQNLDGLANSLPAYRESVSNAELDARWSKQATAFCGLDPESFIETGWESRHPLPVYLDLSGVQPVHPEGQDTSGRWELCCDDDLLQKAGLPPYSSSLFRYLYQPGTGAQSRFIPVVSGAPQGQATVPASAALTAMEKYPALNSQAGLLMVTGFAPLSFEDCVDLLGGKVWQGVTHGKKRLNLDGVYESLTDSAQVETGLGHIFLGAQGKRGRFVEAYHLKLQLLADVFRLVRGYVERRQLPFLNLGADSFRVSLKELGSGLPCLWTARCALVKPEDAFALPVATGEFRYFLRMRGGASAYLPESLGGSTQGSGSVRIRKLLPPDRGRTVVEGTLVSQESLAVSPHDLLWMRLPLPGGRVELYGHLYTGEGLAPGEVRFRTLPQQFDDAVLATLKTAEGVPLARAPFEVVPLLSSPCDLYSLGVLAVRALLVDDKTTLAVALDEVLSLARQVSAEHKADVPLGQRIQSIFERERRYAESLGPHRMSRRGMAPEEGLQLLPPELWYDTLGVLVRLFPGMGPDSFCRDFGDAPTAALETVFNKPLEELEKLLVRSRSLILIDWNLNREINGAIKDCMQRTRG